MAVMRQGPFAAEARQKSHRFPPSGRSALVAVQVGLEWAGLGPTDMGRLFVAQLVKLDADFVRVKRRAQTE